MTNQMFWFGRLKEKVEDALRKEGADIENRLPMLPNVVVDRELISGFTFEDEPNNTLAQGPTSVWKFANTFVDALKKQRSTPA